MNKIKGLLTQIGASEELAGQICEQFECHEGQIQEKYEGVYKTKLSQAKQICVEEVQKYKVEMARKVRLFLEGKSSQIEKRLDQQRSIEEGEAKAMLRQVKELTEGIEVADDAELQNLRVKLEKLETKNTQLVEDKNKAVVAANRANKIALEILERNGSEVVSEETKPEPEPESKTEEAKAEKVVAESKKTQKKQKTLKEAVSKKKIKQAKPKTTRRTLAESQSTKTAKKPTNAGADADILNIANNID